MSYIEENIALAVKVANANTTDLSHRLGAIVARKRDVISVGYNQRKSHPYQKAFGRNDQSIFLHAENSALLRAGPQARGSDLYVARVRGRGVPLLAKPCEGCLRSIIETGIRRIFYTTNYYGYEIIEI
jgi:deoxycytidylate deaminase